MSKIKKANRTFIIAEAGVNHNGSKDIAFKLIDAAVEAGADSIKFQTFKAENLVTKYAKKANYQFERTGGKNTQFEMLKKLELSEDFHFELVSYCSEKKIEFLSTPFDHLSLDFLSKKLKLKTLKIPSGEVTNAPLLLSFGLTGCELIMSTGMSNLTEIEEALGVLAFAFLKTGTNSVQPSKKAFAEAYNSQEGRSLLKRKVTLLHCLTQYPAPLEEVNLRAIKVMQNHFDMNIGYSDHTEGILAPVTAVSLGAVVLEKHFTLDQNLSGPDHKASLEPEELAEMVKSIRLVERLLGSEEKKAMPSELKNIEVARKSIVAAKKIKKGELFSEDNLTTKRPSTGRSPMDYWKLINTKASKDYDIDEGIK